MTTYNIDGKKFDAAHATAVCSDVLEEYREPPTYRKLFTTKKGAWVLVHVSRWQGTRNTAEEITKQEAQAFIAEYGDADAKEKYCADMEEI